jgi:hypothetical protein
MMKSELTKKSIIRYISDLGEFFHLLKSDYFFSQESTNDGIASSQAPILWFRGHENTEYKLQPNLYRKIYDNMHNFGHSTNIFWDEIQKKENQLLDHFKLRNYHLIEHKYQDNSLLWLCTMQHFGAATRFLDWSETALAGLYFALEKYIKEDNKESLRVPCVWILKPEVFNQEMQINNNSAVHSTNCQIPSLIELSKVKKIEKVFISSFSPFNNERVKAQAGSFVLFPLAPIRKGFGPKEHYLENLQDCHQFLLKVVLVQPERIAQQLKQIGIKSSLYFPDMPSISKEVESYIINKH